MDLHYLKLFNTLASELSFSKAANVLFISQPALSMQIKKFEAELGFKLFDRVGKSLQLNENSKILHDYSKQIFELLDEAEFELSCQKTLIGGIVNIGASNTPGTYILPKIIGEFVELYPQVNINLHIANTYEIEKLILENKLDFAINGGESPDNINIFSEKLLYDEVLLVASASSKLVEGGPIECIDLASARFVTHEKNSQMYKMVESIISELGLKKNTFMTLGNIDAVKQAVLVDLGITAIPRAAITSELYFGQLKEIKLRNRNQGWIYPYNLIYRKNRHITIAAKKLIELIKLRMT
ncbi:MAG: LysR substrate-binding domain-containing protein [Clostridia bacterium]